MMEQSDASLAYNLSSGETRRSKGEGKQSDRETRAALRIRVATDPPRKRADGVQDVSLARDRETRSSRGKEDRDKRLEQEVPDFLADSLTPSLVSRHSRHLITSSGGDVLCLQLLRSSLEENVTHPSRSLAIARSSSRLSSCKAIECLCHKEMLTIFSGY